jgi:predicted site-specific integrase-resolvase
MGSGLLTLDEAAHAAGVPRATLYKWVRAGKLRGVKYSPSDSEVPLPGRGMRWYVTDTDLERFLGRPLGPTLEDAEISLRTLERTLRRVVADAESHNGMLSKETLGELRAAIDTLRELHTSG